MVVRASFELRDLNRIDDESEVFEFEGSLVLEWQDARQAFDPRETGVDEKVFQGDYQFDEIATGWFPQVVLVNESGLFEQNGVLLRVRPDGSMRLVQRLNAAAKTDLDLRAYPFDRQRLEALFEVLGFDASEVVFEHAGAPVEGNGVRLPQWEIGRIETSVRRSGTASTLVLSVEAGRKSLFMIRLVVVPLFVIVLLSWSVFWMDKSSVGDRVNISFVAVLTVVAYQIVLSEILPRISYLTLMNGFLNMSFFVVCASVVVSLWVGMLDRRGEVAKGDRIDHHCRWIFPLTYLGLLVLVGVATSWVVA